MADKTILNFITEARKRGFSDMQIRKALEEKNWPGNLIEKSFEELQPKFKLKNQICIFLSNETLENLEKRSKKNMLTVSEQIEDIIRRSCISRKSAVQQGKVDDLLLACFSRGKKRKK